MKPIEENKNSLPDNAFRELKEGEEYVPLMKPEEKHRGNSLVCYLGYYNGHCLLSSYSLSWAEGGASF